MGDGPAPTPQRAIELNAASTLMRLKNRRKKLMTCSLDAELQFPFSADLFELTNNDKAC